MIYACFGHHDCRDTIRPVIKEHIKKVICRDPECEFLVGYQGRFDQLMASVLKELSREYPDLSYSVVLAYHPSEVKLVVEVPGAYYLPRGIRKSTQTLRYIKTQRLDAQGGGGCNLLHHALVWWGSKICGECG